MDTLSSHSENSNKSPLRLLSSGEKICGKCGQIKSVEDFYASPQKKRGLLDWCKECAKAQRKAKVDPKENNDRQLWYNYGITREDYDRMFEEQGGVCKSCGNAETAMINGKVKNLSVDHCHTTGAVRSLLCADCNIALGHIREDPRRASALLAYIEKYCLW